MDDRAADAWEPLLAIADAVAGKWPERARQAALALSTGVVREDDSLGVRLLSSIQCVFLSKQSDRVATARLLESLNEQDDEPWGGFHDGQGMTDRDLSGQLRHYGIRSKQLRFQEGNRKGYELSSFSDAFARYAYRAETSETPLIETAVSNSATPITTNVSDGLPCVAEADVSDVSLLPLLGRGTRQTRPTDSGEWEEGEI